MKESIFKQLFRYRSTEKLSPRENYLTEILAWMLNNMPSFARNYVKLLCEQGEKSTQDATYKSLQADTQVCVENGFIDLVIRTDGKYGFICEHKVDSELSENQMEKYRKSENQVKEKYHSKNDFLTVLLTKSTRQHTQKADIKITWEQLYQCTKNLDDYEENERQMAEQFLLYLTEEGMGMKRPIKRAIIDSYREAMQLNTAFEGLFSDLQDENWEALCPKLESFVSRYNVQANGERWGRIGIDFSDWKPYGIFAGVILKNNDHRLRNWERYDCPMFVVLIDCNIDAHEHIKQSSWFKDMMNGIDEENGFDIDKSPKNKWRLLILSKPLSAVLQDGSYEDQKESMKTAIAEGINTLLKYYNLEVKTTDL